MAREREPWEYWDDHCEAEAEWEERCPECDLCGEKITDETYIDIDGRFMHLSCLKHEYERWTDDYVRDEEDRRREQLHG